MHNEKASCSKASTECTQSGGTAEKKKKLAAEEDSDIEIYIILTESFHLYRATIVTGARDSFPHMHLHWSSGTTHKA